VTLPARIWTIIGAPLNSAAGPDGETRMPAALRAAGLVAALSAQDDGDIQGRIDDPRRDPETGIIGFDVLRRASAELRERLDALLRDGQRPLVLGGDCTPLLGIFAALQRHWRRPGLWFVDGHLDAYDGATSPTGEAADMELRILLGDGPQGLLDLGDRVPLLAAADVFAVGFRHPDESDAPEEVDLVDDRVERLDSRALRDLGSAEVVRRALELADRTDAVWLHLDLDVLDQEVLPAVSYRQPGGLDWDELEELLRPLARHPRLVGASVADLNPDRDPDGRHAARVVRFLTDTLA
jgi:arginase